MKITNVTVEHKNYLGIPIAGYWLPIKHEVQDDTIYFNVDKDTWNIRVRYTVEDEKKE